MTRRRVSAESAPSQPALSFGKRANDVQSHSRIAFAFDVLVHFALPLGRGSPFELIPADPFAFGGPLVLERSPLQ